MKIRCDALQARHNIISNGPFINMRINGEPIGSQLEASGSVEIAVEVAAADWVGADRLRLVANGEVIRGIDPAQSEDYWGWLPIELDDRGRFERTFTVELARDTWVVLEVESSKSMFPVISPQDIPPFNFSDVVGSLAGAFGFGGGVPGLAVDYVFPLTAFAFTNPIWVVTDGDGEFTPPAPPVFECVAGQYVERAGMNTLVETLDPNAGKRLGAARIPGLQHEKSPLARPRGETRDLRIIFDVWGGHAH